MSRIISSVIIVLLCLILVSCRNWSRGELRDGWGNASWDEGEPYGMEYIPKGSFTIGPNDQEVNDEKTPNKTVSVEAFWMDDTEITNKEYRQFTSWVVDSIARQLLSEKFPEYLITIDIEGNPLNQPILNWNENINWNDLEVKTTLSNLFIPDNEMFYGRREIDSRKLYYEYWWIDFQQAALRKNKYNYNTQKYEGSIVDKEGNVVPIENRSSFIMHESVPVYPDTLCWITDFTYSYNEPLTLQYFWHPGFNEYPVVGVTWTQAKAFCNWRSKYQSDYRTAHDKIPFQNYRLPTEIEWEYAARGKTKFSKYPWGGYYARKGNGDFQANFKPFRGDYLKDGGITVMKVRSYLMNDFCLYDMAGNVAEWTSNSYNESAYAIINELNPNYEYNAKPDDPAAMKRKVVRGGSWKDVAYNIQVATRNFEYQDSAKSFIGFRCVRSTFVTNMIVK
jgi:formylglycine-generating enzyme required for sulfatase activity